MSRFRYTRYIPNPADEIDLDELMDRLKDRFLESGFEASFYGDQPGDDSLGLEGLLRALAEILSRDEAVPEAWRQELSEYADSDGERRLSDEVRQLLERIIERLLEAGYLRESEGNWEPREEEGEVDEAAGPARFELTRKGVDFLGFKTLQSLLGSLGKSSFGSHATAALSTGVEADAHSKPYEFGDTLNLDAAATLLSAIRRSGRQVPLPIESADLRVQQSEYQSSCATVIMLDCSHSMILYGEDRFTPAKKVALALAHLIRTRFPGDTFELVLFHDSAERIPLAKLASVKVGPFHTNTSQGLRLSRRLLMGQRKDMRQIIMITDGKPSAMTLPDGRIYKNPFGLDPMILQETFQEVAECRKSAILINTFMLARDYALVAFVQKVARMCRGKAYLTSPVNLARHILLDFMNSKTTTVH